MSAKISAVKHSLSVEDFSFDLTLFAGSDTILSIASVVDIPGITITDTGVFLPALKLRIGGGVAGIVYTISLTATMASGDSSIFEVVLSIAQTAIQLSKFQHEAKTYTVLWDQQLDISDTIVGSTWSSGDLALSGEAHNTNSASAVIGGGTIGANRATNIVALASGQQLAVDLIVYVF